MSVSSEEKSGNKGKLSPAMERVMSWVPELPQTERGKYLFLLTAALLVFVLLFWVLSIPVPEGASSRDAGWEVMIRFLAALFGAFLTPITVQWFIAWIDEQKKPEKTAQFVSDLFLQSDGKVFDAVTRETRGNLLKNILISQAREGNGEYGTDLGDGLVEGYFRDDQTYRDAFTYEITYHPFNGPGSGIAPQLGDFAEGITSRREHYHKIEQAIRFTQHGLKSGDFSKVVVQLAFDDATLRELLDDRNLMFREVIHLLPEDRAAVAALEDEQLALFVEQILNFTATLGQNGSKAQKIGFSVGWADRAEGNCIEIRIDNPWQVVDGLVVHLAFRYPNRRNVTHFIAAAPRPVKQARITLAGTEAMQGLSYFPFVTEFGDKPYDEFITPTRISIESKKDRWWFPISGFVFVWDAEALPPTGESARPRQRQVKTPKP
jgi:hypothetical protein